MANTIIEDGFSGTNNDDVTGRTPDTTDNGNAWFDTYRSSAFSGSSGGGLIQGNQLQLTNNQGGQAIDAEQSDVTITVDWTPAVGVTNRNSIIFRQADHNNKWLFNIREENGDLSIYEIDDGASTQRDTDSFSWTEGNTYELKVVLNGNDITCYVDDSPVLSYSSSLHSTATNYGLLRENGADDTRFDNFIITGQSVNILAYGSGTGVRIV